MFKLQFKPEITAGQVMVAVAAIGAVLGVWKDVSVDIALLKQGQLTQGDAIRTIVIDIRELRREARDARPATSQPAPRMRGG